MKILITLSDADFSNTFCLVITCFLLVGTHYDYIFVCADILKIFSKWILPYAVHEVTCPASYFFRQPYYVSNFQKKYCKAISQTRKNLTLRFKIMRIIRKKKCIAFPGLFFKRWNIEGDLCLRLGCYHRIR